MAIVPGDHLEGHSDSDNPIWRNFLVFIFLIFEFFNMLIKIRDENLKNHVKWQSFQEII